MVRLAGLEPATYCSEDSRSNPTELKALIVYPQLPYHNRVMKTILRFILNLLAVLGAAWLVGGVSVSSGWALVIFALVLGVVNWAIKPILQLLTLPITILTLGIWYLVLNGLLVLLASALVPGFAIHGLWNAIWFAIVLSLINWLLSVIFRTNKE